MTVGAWERGKGTVGRDWCCEIPRYQGHREATMTIMEVSLLTGFYPNQDDLKQVMSRAGIALATSHIPRVGAEQHLPGSRPPG